MHQGRNALLLAALSGLAWSQTALTTIQDTLFKADGTRFSGTLTIRWSTFDVLNTGTVVQQSENVPVVNGNLQIQLAPNAGAQPPANSYTVQYQSDGREQFTETWTVPASTRALRVSEVRTGTLSSSSASGSGSAGNQTPIAESAVVGLVADLYQRPVKGAGYGTNGVAVVDDTGAVVTAVGAVGDCVLVDGTTGPCGPQPIFADAEVPGGIVDGVNNTFTLAGTPQGSSMLLFRNGLYMTPGFDYNLTGSTVQFVTATIPQPGDQLTAAYRVDPASVGNIGAISAAGGTRAHSALVICSGTGGTASLTTLASLGSCDIPATGLNPGDRIEVRFTFAHTGTASAFDVKVIWGSTAIISRHAGAQDVALVGSAEAAVSAGGTQISVQSWGTVLAFLPGIVNAASQTGLKVDIQASLARAGGDRVTLTNYTVLRYAGN